MDANCLCFKAPSPEFSSRALHSFPPSLNHPPRFLHSRPIPPHPQLRRRLLHLTNVEKNYVAALEVARELKKVDPCDPVVIQVVPLLEEKARERAAEKSLRKCSKQSQINVIEQTKEKLSYIIASGPLALIPGTQASPSSP